ncbi:MAG: SUMF1/EgtB/PvdO family nonheme iron enzyme [Chloroflexota bacterium]
MTDEQEKLKIEIEQLKARLATYEARLEGDGAIAQGNNTKAVAKNGILVEGNFIGNIYQGEDPAEDEKRLDIYRRWVLQSTSSLPLRGVDVGASDPAQAQKAIGLANVYVDLDTTQQVKLSAEQKEKRKKEKNGGGDREETRPLPVLEAAISNPRFVLLGDPGGGKSTFVNFLAYCLAADALEPAAGWLAHLSGWPPAKAQLLPLIVTLRDFARSYAERLPAKAEPQHLLDFIKTRLEAQNLGFAAKPLVTALDEGAVIVLLDGLDEVPTQAQRIFVRDAVHAFIERYHKSRFLITCRVLSYLPPEKGKPDLRLSEMPALEIAPFDQAKIDRFVSAWYAELGRLGTVPAVDVDGLTDRLREAVRRPDLQRLAPNPLLLTVMALVHTHKGRLPDARALLYEETVDILLWRWEQIKLGGKEDAPRLRQYLLEAGRTDVDLKRVLWELAYNAHAASQPGEKSDVLADIAEHRILKALAALKCDEANLEGDLSWAKRVVDLMKIRAGLLLERQPEVFTFPHRTFQEYLAGAHLAAQSDFARQAAALAGQGALWREAILYAVGKLVYVSGDVEKPLALVAELCPEEANDSQTAWQLAWLAGDAMQEIGLKRVRDSVFGRDLLRRVQNRIRDLLEAGKLAPKERARAGDTLSALGDPRFDPDFHFLPKGETLGFIHIPAGKFSMGSDPRKDKNAQKDEQPQHELVLPAFWLAKYPVTVAQFSAFVTASGYKPENTNSLRGAANHPVVYVTWPDALAYTRWLDQQMKLLAKEQISKNNAALFLQGLDIGKLQVTLPSEAEWEKAARGSDGRIYPWGDGFDPNKANIGATGIGGTSAVGAFPAGKSPYGLLDVSGNVWEWTRTIWDDKYKYPYKMNDGREDLNQKGVTRTMRGGAFNYDRVYARCACRGGFNPDYRNYNIGFRVVVSPVLLS